MRWFVIFAAGLLVQVPVGSARAQVTLAVTAGPSLVTLTDDETPWSLNGEAPWSWWGSSVGVSAEFPVSDLWGLELGSSLSLKGEYEDGGSGLILTRTIPFVESTILADRRFENGLHLQAGAFMGYAYGDHPVIDLIERFDFGVAVGARIDVGLIGGLGLALDALYSHGLRNVGDNVGFGATRALNASIGPTYTIG